MKKNRKGTEILVIAALAFVIFVASVGFADYAEKLNVNGTVNVGSNKWSVHFVTNSYAESTGSVQASAHNITNTTASYTVTLAKPGDFYEFSANVINDGTFNAELNKITLTALTSAQSKYLTYTLTYDGVTYQTTTDNLSLSLPCASGSNTKVVKVRVSYVQPESSSDLPQEATTITLDASLDYAQAA